MKNKRVLISLSILLVVVVLFVTINSNTAKASNLLVVDKSITCSIADASAFIFLNNGDIFLQNWSNYAILDGTTYIEKKTGSLNISWGYSLTIQGQFANGNLIFGARYDDRPYIVIKNPTTLNTIATYYVANSSNYKYTPHLAGFDNSGNAVFWSAYSYIYILDSNGNQIAKSQGGSNGGYGKMNTDKTQLLASFLNYGRASYINLNTLDPNETWSNTKSIVNWENDNPRYTSNTNTINFVPIINTKSFLYAYNYWEIVDISRGSTYAQRLVAYGYLENGIGFADTMNDGNIFISGPTNWKIVNSSTGNIVKEGILYNSIHKLRGDKFFNLTSGVLNIYKIQDETVPTAPGLSDLNGKYISVDGIPFKVLNSSGYAVATKAEALGVELWSTGLSKIQGLGNNKSYIKEARYMTEAEWTTHKAALGNPAIPMWLEDLYYPGDYVRVRIVETTGAVTTYTGSVTSKGIRPALFLEETATIESGTGTLADPYVLENNYASSTANEFNPIPVLTVVDGQAFSIGVTGVDSIPNGSTSDGVTVTNINTTDGFIQLDGTLTGVGFQVITINGTKFTFKKIAAPSGATVTAIFS